MSDQRDPVTERKGLAMLFRIGELETELAKVKAENEMMLREYGPELRRLREESAQKTADLVEQTKLTVAKHAEVERLREEMEYIRLQQTECMCSGSWGVNHREFRQCDRCRRLKELIAAGRGEG